MVGQAEQVERATELKTRRGTHPTTLTLWLKAVDRERFAEVCEAKLTAHFGSILTARLVSPNALDRIGESFVLGKRGLWLPEEMPFVYIRNHPMYEEGIVLSTYSLTDVECHLKSKPINITAGVHREELIGGHTDFVERVFGTYDLLLGQRRQAGTDFKEAHFILYEKVNSARHNPQE